MNVTKKAKCFGFVTITVKGLDGNPVKVVKAKNRIPDIGLNMITRYFAEDSGFPVDPLTNLVIGTGTTPASAGDIDLETEVSSVSITSKSSSAFEAEIIGEFAGAAVEGVNLTELGIKNSPADELLARIVLPGSVVLPTGFSLLVTWAIIFSYTQSDPKLVFTNQGLELAASKLVGDPSEKVTRFAIGTGTTNPLPTDTALETQVDEEAITVVNVTGNQVSHSAVFTGPLASITESGLFNIDDKMASRVVFDGSPLSLPAGNTSLTLITEFVYGGP
jgi:hypothetical protein